MYTYNYIMVVQSSAIRWIPLVFLSAILISHLNFSHAFILKHQTRITHTLATFSEIEPSVSHLSEMSVKDALKACCGAITVNERDLLPNCDIVKAAPTICKFVIANPKAFLVNRDIAKFHGFDIDSFNSSTPLSHLAKYLPVLYIAGRYRFLCLMTYFTRMAHFTISRRCPL